MSDSNNPSVARDIYFIHLVITRSLNVALEHCQSCKNQKIDNHSLESGFLTYVQSLVTLLDSHHIVEDEVIFPYFQGKLENAPFETMNSQHLEMLPVLEQMKVTIDNLTNNSAVSDNLSTLQQLLIQIRDIWEPHFQLEELYLTPENISNIIDQEEEIRLTHLFAQEAGKHIHPDYLLIPFILYNLSPENRAVMSQVFPPFLIEKVASSDWQSQWKPMSPFLIET